MRGKFENHISDKGLVSILYKELIQLNNKKMSGLALGRWSRGRWSRGTVTKLLKPRDLSSVPQNQGRKQDMEVYICNSSIPMTK